MIRKLNKFVNKINFFGLLSLFLIQSTLAQELNKLSQPTKTLHIAQTNIFNSYVSKHVYCLDDFYYSSDGQMWFSTCGTSNYSNSGLVRFNGYTFDIVENNNKKLNRLRKNYIGINKDILYGYATDNYKAYLYYYDIAKNNIQVYDSVYANAVQHPKNNSYYQEEYYPFFQRVHGDTIYTYIREGQKIKLKLFDTAGQSILYAEEVDLPQGNQISFINGHNTYKEWFFGVDEKNNEIIAVNLLTKAIQKFKVPIDPEAISFKNSFIKIFEKKLKLSLFENESFIRLIFSINENANTNELLVHQQTVKENNGQVLKYFENKHGHALSRVYSNEKYKLHITVPDDNVEYDVSALRGYIQMDDIIKVESNNYLNYLNILTSQGFYMFKFSSSTNFKKLNVHKPVRGMEVIHSNELLYIEETGVNQIKHYNLEEDKAEKQWEGCAFNNLKLAKKDQEIWGTQYGNLAYYSVLDETCTTLNIAQPVFLFDFTPQGDVIFNDNDFQFWKYNIATQTTTPLMHNAEQLQLGDRYSNFLVANDVVWIATMSGLYKYDLKNSTLTNLNEVIDNFNFSFISLAKANENELWLGSFNSGLVILNTVNYTFSVLDESKGLCNNTIASITKDHQGFFWVGTYYGLALVNSKGKLIRNFYQNDGLSHNECNRHANALFEDGRLAIGSVKGISIIDTKQIIKEFNKDDDLRIFLSEIAYYKSNNAEKSIIKNGFENLETIKLPPTNRNIELTFATTNFIQPQRTSFSYMLEGLHTDWISIGSQHHLSLNELPPGEFTLKIRANDRKGNWTQNTIALKLKVEQFFYKQIGFYILLIIGISIFGFANIKLLKIKIHKANLNTLRDKEKIENQAKKLQELDKTKNEFFTNITHEFRTPLTVIKGLTQLLKSKHHTENKHHIIEIENNTNELLAMVNQILDLRKLEANQLTLTNVVADLVVYMEHLVHIFQYSAKQKNINLICKAEVEELLMDFDVEKMKSIGTNLISNAIKFTDEGGTIAVSIRKDAAHNQAVLCVKDSGIGISDQEISKVFDLYYQSQTPTSTTQKGSGIGLYYTKKLVEAMNGTIEVQSQVAVGTTFLVKLPIRTSATEQTTTQDPFNELSTSAANIDNATADDKALPNVLIVDDHLSIQNVLKAQLTNFNLTFANNGQEGVSKARTVVPDLIISDVMMPVMDGFELCQILKDDIATSHIPIILLTAKSDQPSKMEGLKAKADVYIKKPFEYEELLLHINNLIESRKKLQKTYISLGKIKTFTAFPKEKEFILRFREEVFKGLKNSELSIPYLCDQLNLSRSSLHNKITALTGLSTSNYINLIKLEKAKKLLQSKYISEVSDDLCFTNLSYFSRLFKKQYGVSPKAYKDSLKERKNNAAEE